MPISEQEIDRLEELLASDVFKNEAMPLDTLQGFLCAVVSGPDTIPPSVWLPEALGESPEYESAEQARETLDLLMRFHDSIAAALFSDDPFDLIVYGLENNPDELDFASWCDGYVYGSQIGGIHWFEAAGEHSEDLSEMMEAFFLLNGMLREDARKHGEPWLSRKEEEKALAKAQEDFPATIRAIYKFWLSKRAMQSPVRREAPKVGRNEPCPCGSGKKFKQCCGREETLH